MTPLVDIVMPTYRHEKFVAEAIESVLAQKTKFEYRLLIGDDCSPDGTQAVIKSYAEKYPNRIEPYLFTNHVGIQHRERVAVGLLRRTTAKYVTILEGDDYWTDPYKLQKQVDFLERHPECSLCFHNAEMFYEDGSQPPMNLHPADQKEISTVEDIATGMVPIPCTVLFRNNLLGELPDCFYEVTNADWMLFLLLAEHGNVGYINEVMAAYRMHGGGIWSRLTSEQRVKDHINTYQTIDAHLNFKYHRVISEKIAKLPRRQKEQNARSYLDQYHKVVRKGEIKKGLRLLWQATRFAPWEVLRPRRLAAVLKNGFFGIFWKNPVQN